MTIDQLKDIESIISLCVAGLFFIALAILLISHAGNGLRSWLIATVFLSLLFFVASSYSILISDVATNPLTPFFILIRLLVMIGMVVSMLGTGYKIWRLRNE